MKYKRLKTDSYKLIPVLPLDPPKTKTKEESDYKKFIHWISHLNKPYLDRGRGQKVIIDGVQYYRDAPNISYKLLKKDGKIHQYITLPKGDEPREGLIKALATDIKSFRLDPTKIVLKNDHLHSFAIKGNPHHALDLDKDFSQTIKLIFDATRKQDQLLFNLTLKEVEDHEEKRKELKDRLAGMDPDDIKSIIWHRTKQATISIGKWLYEGLEEETRKKHQQIIQNLKKKGWFQNSKSSPMTQRKLAEKNRYMEVEMLFLLWSTAPDQVKTFKNKLQKAMNDIQGENQLEVIPVKPNLERISKGYLQYDLPHLCLYQKELSQILYLPSIHELDDSFYYEHEQKTEIPAEALQYEIGTVALGKRMDTQEVIAMPRAVTEIDLDDRGIPTLISGKKGSGKTQFLINQVADTFCFGASSIEEWREKARSAVVFDVSDGDMLREIYELVPECLEDRVIILNHADLDNPLPITNHDILRISQIDGFEEEIAAMDTQILMDSLGDKNQTVAVERHFKTALQASYLAGKGNIIDAMRIIEEPQYRSEIAGQIGSANVFLPNELRKMDRLFEDPKQLETIDNRISRLKNTQPWIDGLAQEPTDGLDFWKWINGDDDGAYLVLIYIPKRINKSFRSFLFAHYLVKLWYMTEAREIISKKDRREFLVIVDELHQIFGHRVVPTILEAIYKEARKYRARYVFTIHGWSSIKSKEIKDTIKDASGNYIMLKGGDDMFSSLEKEFSPYTVADFNSLMKLSYTGLFKIDIKKRTHVFQAQLMEPASVRYKKQRSISLETFRKIKNKYGRPKREVRAAMINKEEGTKCYNQPSLEDELAEIIGENESRKAN